MELVRTRNFFRYPGSIAKFRMLHHDLVAENPELSEMTERSKRGSLDHDGLGSVEYEVDEVESLPLYTSIRIKLRPPPVKVVRGFRLCRFIPMYL